MVGGGHPFQFFPTEELDLLDLKEDKWNEYLNEKTKRRTRGDSTKKPEKFTDDDANKRAELVEQGFSDWSKREFNSFIKGCESFGRNNFKDITEEIETKTLKEVKEYAAVFWEKVETLPNGKELIERIEEGEKNIERLFHINSVLESKKQSISDGEEVLFEFLDDSKFSFEEDLYLAKYLLEQGYGEWENLRYLFKTLPQFQYNFWIQTRTIEDIQERCDFLISLMEKPEGSPKKFRKIDKITTVEVTSDYNWVITFPKYSLS